MENQFSFRRDICVNGNTETIELDGTTEDVLRVLYAMNQPQMISPNIKEMLQDLQDESEVIVEVDTDGLTPEEKAHIKQVVDRTLNTLQADEGEQTNGESDISE